MASKSILPVIRSAQRGDAECQYRLGRVYLDGGEGLAANAHAAYLWLNRAAQQGIEAAWRAIGERISPEAAEGDPQLARWYALAAANGCIRAKRMLARILVGDTTSGSDPGDTATARMLLEQAAASGDAKACRDLARLLLASPTRDRDAATARVLLLHAHQHGLLEVARDLADLFWAERALVEARAWYERCPIPWDAEQHYRLGILNTLLGQPGNRLLEHAASNGHLAACEALGLRFATGSTEHRRDLKKAARWLEPAAMHGSARAAYLLSTIHRHRASGAFDGRRARRWLLRAARFGHADACLQAGITILRQIDTGDTPIDDGDDNAPDVAAAEFLSQASRNGRRSAQRYLARLIRPIAPEFLNHGEDWLELIGLAERKNPSLGARLKMGYALGLTARELLAVDPVRCDQGRYFVIAIPGGRPIRRRLVPIESAMTRRLVNEAKEMLRHFDESQDDVTRKGGGSYRSHYLKLRHLVRQYGHRTIEQALFPRTGKSVRGGIDTPTATERSNAPDPSTAPPRLQTRNVSVTAESTQGS